MFPKRFVLKRLLLLVPVLIGVATLVFSILHLSPGDPALTIAGERASQEFVERIRADLGLNDPIWVQYLDFLGNVARFDFGGSRTSSTGTRPSGRYSPTPSPSRSNWRCTASYSASCSVSRSAY